MLKLISPSPIRLCVITGLVIGSLFIAFGLSMSPLYAQVGCIDIIVQAGDSLSGIAARHLGNLSSYNQIVTATNTQAAVDSSYAKIDNPNTLAVGWKLCVPSVNNQLVAPALNPDAPAALPTPTEPVTTTLEEEYANRWDGKSLFPLTIEWLRQQTYPGSDIVIEDTLAPGANYQRYLVTYRSEGLKIYALLTVPNGVRPATGWPAIIFNHGYIPPEIYRTTERYIAYVDGFARAGYVVFRLDYRGHGFSEGEAKGAYGYPDYAIDVLNALASVKALPDVDPNRIGMWGHSLGGYLTLRAMVTTKDIKAGVIWAGVVADYTGMITQWRRPVPVSVPQRARRWRTLLINKFGPPDKNPKFWASLSANSYLADLSGPLQLHHGGADEDVPEEFSASLFAQATAAGKVTEYYTYPGDNHNLSVNFNTVMQRSIAFFDKYVKEGSK